VIAAAVGACGVALVAWQLRPAAPEPFRARVQADAPAEAPSAPLPGSREPAGRASAAEARSGNSAVFEAPAPDSDQGEVAEDPTGDLELYASRPMSAVPHRVVRAWGARGSGNPPGAVGAFVVVDPAISDAGLEALIADIRRYHVDATALSVRILDSERAASYDRHSDGGAFAAAHLVGRISRNETLGTDRVEIRGRVEDLASSDVR